MILTGKPAMFGVTFDTAALSVAARVFDSAGAPVTAWTAMANYDGFSYQLPITFAGEGAFSVKKVVFTDGTFTVRNLAFTEADDAVQVVSAAAAAPGGTASGSMRVQMKIDRLQAQIESEEL